MKQFQYSAKGVTESTSNVSEGSWLPRRRGPRYWRKISPGFLCDTFSVPLHWGQTDERFGTRSHSSETQGFWGGISCQNRDASLIDCRIAKPFVETSRGHRTSGSSLSLWSAERQTSLNPRGWAGTQAPAFPVGTQVQFSHYVAHMGGTDLHTNVIYNKFVHACISFPAKTILSFVLFVNSYAVYHNLS